MISVENTVRKYMKVCRTTKSTLRKCECTYKTLNNLLFLAYLGGIRIGYNCSSSVLFGRRLPLKVH